MKIGMNKATWMNGLLKRKIFEVIQEIQLPAKGEALDFGCGNGVLTEIVRQALPSWEIYGTDISNKAIINCITFLRIIKSIG